MKRVLFCLLALAAFAAANACTKAWYEIHAFNFLSIKDAPHLDSIYYREQPAPEEVHEWYQKYYYKDGLIHHSVFKFRDNDPVDNRIYLSADEVTLTRSGRELLLSDSVAGDTVYFFQKMYNSGELVQTVVHKLTDLYASEQDYDPASGRRTFAEYFFRNDTLVSRTVYDYGSGMRDSAYYYYVGVPGDEYKCAEYRGEEDAEQEYFKRQQDYVFADADGDRRGERARAYESVVIVQIRIQQDVVKHRVRRLRQRDAADGEPLLREHTVVEQRAEKQPAERKRDNVSEQEAVALHQRFNEKLIHNAEQHRRNGAVKRTAERVDQERKLDLQRLPEQRYREHSEDVAAREHDREHADGRQLRQLQCRRLQHLERICEPFVFDFCFIHNNTSPIHSRNDIGKIFQPILTAGCGADTAERSFVRRATPRPDGTSRIRAYSV